MIGDESHFSGLEPRFEIGSKGGRFDNSEVAKGERSEPVSQLAEVEEEDVFDFVEPLLDEVVGRPVR